MVLSQETKAIIVNDQEEEDKSSEDSDAQLLDGEQPNLCDICYEEYPPTKFFGLSCGHEFCKACMREHLKSNIMDGKIIKIPCMMADCSLEFKPEDVHRFGSQRTYKKYLKFKRNIDVDLNPDLRWCPDPKCMHYVEREGRSKVSTCECGARVCIECGEYEHPNTKCGQQEDHMFKKWKLSEDGKNCPKCNMVIIKNEGCNHMTCVKCQHDFCWYCL